MNFSAATELPLSYLVHQDRSLGREGTLLRQSLNDASAARPLDRGHEIFSRLADALELAERNDQIRINPKVFSRVLSFLDLIPREVPLPAVVVESEGEIGLDWDEGKRKVLSVTIDETPMMGFSSLFGREPLYGRLDLDKGVPDTLRFLLARLFPKKRRIE
jgi:hypothetical protein